MTRLLSGTTHIDAEKTLCVYRYTDVEDEIIKYVGIVKKENWPADWRIMSTMMNGAKTKVGS